MLRKAVHHAQAEAGALADVLGGEERFEGAGGDIRGHAGAGIGHGNHDVLAGSDVAMLLRIGLVECRIADLDRQPAAVGHGVARVEHQVEQRRGQLPGIDAGQPQLPIEQEFTFDMFAEGSSQQLFHAENLPADVDVLWHQGLLARERQQAPGQLRATFGGRHDAFGERAQFRMRRQLFGDVFRVAQDDGQEVVEVVRHAAGELTHGLHLLGLAEFLIEVVDGGPLALERIRRCR